MLLQQWGKQLAATANISIAASASVPVPAPAAAPLAGDVRHRGTWLKTTPKHIWQLSRAGQGHGQEIRREWECVWGGEEGCLQQDTKQAGSEATARQGSDTWAGSFDIWQTWMQACRQAGGRQGEQLLDQLEQAINCCYRKKLSPSLPLPPLCCLETWNGRLIKMERRQQDERTTCTARGTSKPNMFNGVIYVGATLPAPTLPLPPVCPACPACLDLGAICRLAGVGKKLFATWTWKLFTSTKRTRRERHGTMAPRCRQRREQRKREGERERERECAKNGNYLIRARHLLVFCVWSFFIMCCLPQREAEKQRQTGGKRVGDVKKRASQGRRGRQTGNSKCEMGKSEMENGANSLACHLNEAVRRLAALCFCLLVFYLISWCDYSCTCSFYGNLMELRSGRQAFFTGYLIHFWSVVKVIKLLF